MALDVGQNVSQPLTPTELHSVLIDDLGIEYSSSAPRVAASLERIPPQKQITVFLALMTLAQDDGLVESRFVPPVKILETVELDVSAYIFIRQLEQKDILTRKNKAYGLNLQNRDDVLSFLQR